MYSYRVIGLYGIPIFSDGVNISSKILDRIYVNHIYNNSIILPKDSKFKIGLVNELSGLGTDNVYCLTIIDFILNDRLTAIDTKFIIHNTRNELSDTLNTCTSDPGDYLLNPDDYYTEISFLVHFIFGPPDWIYKINYNFWTHQYWAKYCKSYTFKYHKIDISDQFIRYLNSNSFYIPDNLSSEKYILQSDSDSEILYSENERSPDDSDSCISISDPEINPIIISISEITAKRPQCMVKYRNIFVLDGCWSIKNSYTVKSPRDVILLLKSSCRWRDCEYQYDELYLVERPRIEPSSEFSLYYIGGKLFSISQRHSHINLQFLQKRDNRIDITNRILELDPKILKIIYELNLCYCVVDVAVEGDRFILDILPWGWNGPLAHEPILDWRSLRLLHITDYNSDLKQMLNCGIDYINDVFFIFIESDSQLRNAPFGNNVHPDDIKELEYQFS